MLNPVKSILAIVFGFMMLSSNLGFAEQDIYPNIFDEANEKYKNGDFSEAAETYEALIKDGYGNANVHYNLANCYYRMDKNPLAILHYEKALKQNPDFEDAKANLRLAQKKNIDEFEVLPQPLMTKVISSILELFSVTTWSILTVVISFLAFVLLFLFYYKGRTHTGYFAFSMISMAFSFLLLFISWQADLHTQDNAYSIVVSANVYVKTEPNVDATDALILHEGTKVKCLTVLDGWCNISLLDGRVGWVEEDALLEI